MTNSEIVINQAGRSIVRNGVEVALSDQQYLIFSRIADAPAGLTADELFDLMYTPANSPISGFHLIYVQRVRANKRLSRINVRIATSNGRGHKKKSIYTIEVMAA